MLDSFEKRTAVYLLLTSLSYLVLLKLGLDSLIKPIRFLLLCALLVECIIALTIIKSYFSSFISGFFILYVLVFLVISIFLNPMALGAVFKFIVYLLIFLIYRSTDFSVTKFIESPRFIFLVIAVSIYQIYSNDLEYINMVQRLSGIYYKHSSGFALFLCFPIGYLIFEKKTLLGYAVAFVLFYFLFLTGSRSGVLACIFAIIIVYFKTKFTIGRFFIGVVVVLMLLPVLVDIIRTNPIFIRFGYMLSDGFDGSSLSRITYVKRAVTTLGVTPFGHGVGSFALMYEENFGKRLGAHNNFLLFLIEWGVIGFIAYILHIGFIFSHIVRKGSPLMMFLFLVFYLGGSLNNNFYYVVPMVLFFMHLGVMCRPMKQELYVENKS